MAGETYEDIEYIYHYTSSNGLMGILESKCFFATHVRFMNDAQELREGQAYYSKEKMIKALREEAAKYYAKKYGQNLLEAQNNDGFDDVCNSIFEQWYPAYERNQTEQIYVTSFTSRRDSLAHWLTYGKSATSYCLKLNKEKLENNEHSLCHKALTYLEAVDYSADPTSSVRQSMRNYVEAALEVLHEARDDEIESNDLLLGQVIVTNLHSLQVDCAVVKNVKFKDEKEHRLITVKPLTVVMNGKDPVDYFNYMGLSDDIEFKGLGLEVKFRSSASGIITPYLSVPFDISAIEEIIIGPTNHEEEAIKGLELYIESQGLDITVSESKCPFRSM